jgi:N-methylhydantoinase A
MANAARVHAVENGKELSTFTMIAYGGGAPLHASRLCEKLGISEMLVPPGAGVGSAIGFLRAPFGFEAVRGVYTRLSQFDVTSINEILQSLTDEAISIANIGLDGHKLVIERKAFMRYRGQGWEIPVILPGEPFGTDGSEKLRGLFEREYTRLFGRPLEGLDIEVMNWSVRAATETIPTAKVKRAEASTDASFAESRRIYDPRTSSFQTAVIVNRKDMESGARIAGPAAIVERETTTIVTATFEAIMQPDGCLLLQRKASPHV